MKECRVFQLKPIKATDIDLYPKETKTESGIRSKRPLFLRGLAEEDRASMSESMLLLRNEPISDDPYERNKQIRNRNNN